MGWDIRKATLAVAVMACAPSATADIGKFNAAIQSQDYKAAAAAARDIWAGFDRSSPDTAVVAREFGFASFRAGEFELARDFGRFLVDEGGALPVPDDQPLTSAVLFRLAEYRLGPTTSTRSALATALQARANAGGADTISILAAETFYTLEWTSSNWAGVRDSAEIAATLLQRGGSAFAAREMAARTLAGAASFLRSKSHDDYNRIVDVHDMIVKHIDQTQDQRRRGELIDLKFQAEAWSMAMLTYFNTVQQTGSNIPRNVRARTLANPTTAMFADAPPPNACRGSISSREISYPGSAEFRGFSGAVIVRLSFDERGAVTDHKILSAVPARAFAVDVERQAPNFRLRRHQSDAPNCSLAVPNYVLRLIFQMH